MRYSVWALNQCPTGMVKQKFEKHELASLGFYKQKFMLLWASIKEFWLLALIQPFVNMDGTVFKDRWIV